MPITILRFFFVVEWEMERRLRRSGWRKNSFELCNANEEKWLKNASSEIFLAFLEYESWIFPIDVLYRSNEMNEWKKKKGISRLIEKKNLSKNREILIRFLSKFLKT